MQDDVLKINEISGNIQAIDSGEFDAGEIIAYRTQLKEISVKTFFISGMIAIVLGFLLMIINSIYFEQSLIYIACGLICVVGLILVIESPLANTRNILVRKINSYPNIAIIYSDKKFYIITDRIHTLDVEDILQVEYAKLQIYKTAWMSLTTVGVVKIKSTRGVVQVYQVTNAPQAVKAIKHIIATFQKKRKNSPVNRKGLTTM